MSKPSRREVLVVAAVAVGSAWARGPRALAARTSERVLIPAGTFLKGTSAAQAQALAARLGFHPSWFDGELPLHELWLPAFEVDRFPVTNLRYAAFCASTGHPAPSGWRGRRPPSGSEQHPVVGVDRQDARAFAAWAGGALPTEAQWEKAARGTDGRGFPWGDAFDADACTYDPGGPTPPPGLTPVDAHPAGASPYGVEDLVGNAAEWCGDGPNPMCAWIKGGAWVNASIFHLRCAARCLSGAANNQAAFLGFRCVYEV